MIYFAYFGVLVFLVWLALFIYSRKFVNPYKLIMVFGKKGCGKSTTMTKLCLRHLKAGWTVYSTEPLPGAYLVPADKIGYVQFKPDSVLLVDEVGMIWDNRNFKNFKPEVRDFFKLQRHYKVKVYLFSQTFDIDKKLRDLTDEMYLLVNVMHIFSYGKRILKHIVLNDSTADSPSSIAENLRFDSILWFWCGSRFFTFIPKYAKYFDSFGAPQLDYYEFEQPVDLPVQLKGKQKCVDMLNRLYLHFLALFLRSRRR